MDKVKIQDIAAEASLTNTELVDKAKELGFDVVAGNSTISMENAGILVDYAISGTLPKGFKKSIRKRKGVTIAKKKSQSGLTRGLGKILEEVEEAYEKDLNDIDNTSLYNELKIFFDEVYRKRIHISCL
jgi:translation initiation factor IF-2